MTTGTRIAPDKPKAERLNVRTLDITVLAGGPGVERDVSLNSGRAVLRALTHLGHNAVLCDVGPDDLSALDRSADFVFIALHGEFGEDGVVQAELDARGIRYSGSGAAASRLAMDKAESKRHFQRAGIPTPPYEVVGCDGLDEFARKFPVPAVVKPVASGSSVDTYIVRTRDELHARARQVAERLGQVLVEQYIDGPELTVGILGSEALPVCEIRTTREFYDYEAKYLDDHTEYRFDLDLPASLIERVSALSVTAHTVLGCRAFSRVDWMVDAVTHEPFVLEINTIPGFTDHSLVPKAAAIRGLSFEQLCARIIDLSLDT